MGFKNILSAISNAEAAPENSREGYEAFNEALQQMNAAKTNGEAQDGF